MPESIAIMLKHNIHKMIMFVMDCDFILLFFELCLQTVQYELNGNILVYQEWFANMKTNTTIDKHNSEC